METTLPLPFLISVAVPPGLDSSEGLSRGEVSCLGCVFFDVTQQNLDKLLHYLDQHSSEFHTFFDVTAVESKDDIISLLDHGARKIFVQPERLAEFADFKGRVAPAVAKLSNVSVGTEYGILLKDFDHNKCDVAKFLEHSTAEKLPPTYIKPIQGTNFEQFVAVCSQISAIPILPSTGLTTNKDDQSKIFVSTMLSGAWISDRPDKLMPTTQTGVYQSRKRGLWYKGATSGDTQELVRVSLDCDNDALKFIIKQKGKFCHLNQFGCFGDLKGVSKLEQTLVSRKESAPQGSYTARLFSDEKLLRAKIMEEAEELCDAQTPEEIAFEAADLIYFALTKAVSKGVSLSDIERNLDAKSLKVKRRTGNAKGKWAEKEGITNETVEKAKEAAKDSTTPLTSAPAAGSPDCPGSGQNLNEAP
ncbi:hypothetical protein PG997_009861 [Apiospora hydei]|uniref:Phosphoribosyl-AMP cyclohydrolase domain-containing protein n=1 Tax=Apiospora hydei TaxID=1337664 RepID=A0ABR1VZB5_9PEZI